MRQDLPRADEGVAAPTYRNGRLTWYGLDLASLAEAHRTPCHVGGHEAVLASVAAFRRAFASAGLDVAVRFSVKSNPVPALLQSVIRSGAGLEVCCRAELELALALGARPDRLVVSWLRDPAALVRGAARHGVELLVVATGGQLETVLREADDFPAPLRVALRLSPELWQGRWSVNVNSAARGAPIGFRPGDRLQQAMDRIAAHPRLRLAGVHVHLGSGISSTAPYRAAFRVLEQVIRRATRWGHRLEVVDMGGGIGLSSAPALSGLHVVRSLLSPRASSPSANGCRSLVAEVARSMRPWFQRLAAAGLAPRTLIAEPGRALAGPCQLLLLGVREVIERDARSRFLLCDAGAMSLTPMLIAEHHRVLPLVLRPGPRATYRVLGDLPTSLDRVAAGAELCPMRAGDHIAVLDTGAYCVSMNNTFGGPRPPIVWIENGTARLARRRETVTEVFARDDVAGR